MYGSGGSSIDPMPWGKREGLGEGGSHCALARDAHPLRVIRIPVVKELGP